MLFTFPSRYWYAIGLLRVFSLGGWARRIHTGFHVSRATQDTAMLQSHFVYGGVTLSADVFQHLPLRLVLQRRGPTTPDWPEPDWFGLFPVRSPLLGESLLFSLPPGTKMFQFPGFASYLVG